MSCGSNPTAPNMNKEKCYISRDESDDWIWVWRKPSKGLWSPTNVGGKEFISYQRADRSLENVDCYLASDFKKKFGITIRQKTKKCVHLSVKLLHNEDYKLISDDPKRKR